MRLKTPDEISKSIDKEEYNAILAELYNFVNTHNSTNNLVDIILDFCEVKNITPELIGDIISDDNAFKLALELNCISNGVFRQSKYLIAKDSQEVESLDDWL